MARRCYYEILGVPLNVDNPTLRTAYKKCALKWHPDKNPDNVEIAKEEFQLVQQAFEVLSDPHERAWYDEHRDAILKGGLGKDYKDDSINLYPFFSSTCYQGYGDGEKGFYTVYREVFNQIFAEDVDYDPEEKPDNSVPNFGQSESSYEEVIHPFYSYWENYCTAKSFVWLDEFDLREAPNRRVMRAMEKENKKIREKARKQRNEEIRQLVAFVRKRDKRLEKHRKHLEEKAAENALKVQMNRLRQLEDRKREIAASTEAEWVKMENVEKELLEIEKSLDTEFGDFSDDDDDEDDNDSDMAAVGHLYCVACNKLFKNEKSFGNHESSRKHKDNVATMQVSVHDNFDIPISDPLYLSSDDVGIQDSTRGAKAAGAKKKAKAKKVLKAVEESSTNGHASLHNTTDEDKGAQFMKPKKQTKKKCKKKILKEPEEVNGSVELPNLEAREEDTQHALPQASFKPAKNADKRLKKKQAGLQSRRPNDDIKILKEPEEVNGTVELPNLEAREEDTQHALPQASFKPAKNADKRLKKKQAGLQSRRPNDDIKILKEPEEVNGTVELPNLEAREEDTQHALPQASFKPAKNADKRLKKKQAGLQSRRPNDDIKDLTHSCAVCKVEFPSKNKLFQHLKTTGHSVYLPKPNTTGEEKGTNSKCKDAKYLPSNN